MNKAFEKILERLEELHERYINQYGVIGGNPMAFSVKECMEIVQEVAEEYNDDWIPCSERLPDIEVDVLLTLRNLDIYTGFRANTDGYFYVDGVEGKYVPFDDIIGWKPLPKPYIEK